MTTAAPARLVWVEACRGIAAITVVFYHVARHFDKNYGMPVLKCLLQFGHAGVDLFFVISGFVILFVHYDDIGNPHRIGHYARRRLTRVLPTYWVAVAVTLAMDLSGGHSIAPGDIAWSALPVPSFRPPIVDVAWTLQYEFVFYALFAVLLLNRNAGLAVMAIWLSVILVAESTKSLTSVPTPYWGLFNIEFLAGMAVGCVLRRGRLEHYRIVLCLGLGMFVVSAASDDLGWLDGYGPVGRLAFGLASVLVVAGAVEASRRSVRLVPPVLRTLGSASYSIYLFQFVFIGLAWKLCQGMGIDKTMPPAVGAVFFAAATIAGGVLISRFVEYPLISVCRNIGKPGRAPVIKPDLPTL